MKTIIGKRNFLHLEVENFICDKFDALDDHAGCQGWRVGANIIKEEEVCFMKVQGMPSK